jgi:aminoglycoside phosphotransferase (APT) family kinase protein
MTVPAELRRGPPAATLQWVAEQIGPRAKVVRVRRRKHAWASAVHELTVLDRGERYHLILRRWIRTDLPPDPGVVENETAILSALAATSLPVPRLVASDTSESVVLMTRLPGSVDLAPRDPLRFVRALAATLHEIHSVSPPAAVYEYDPWLETTETPPWTRAPEQWERAIEVAYSPRPPNDALCHRDYHPGNVLWSRGTPTGVVDWSHACNGPRAADVAHCRLNLALLFGLDVANDFSESYGDAGHVARFDVEQAVSAYGIVDHLWRYHDAGRADLTREVAIARLDNFVADAVRRCG